MKRPSLPRLFLLASIAAAAHASAATLTIGPVADAFVSAANQDSNYGGAGAIGVSAASLSKGEFDSLLRFDFSSIKSGFDTTFGAGNWAITSVTLQLTSTSPGNPIFNGNGAGPGGTNINSAGLFSIKWMQNDSWVEGIGTPAAPDATGITYSSLPSFLSGFDQTLGTYSFNGATSGNNTWSLGLGSSFLADSTSGNQVSLLMLPADSSVSYLADSRSFANTTQRPLLTVTASPTPEPCAGLLLATSAAGWLGSRRRNGRCA